jgi:hypothetical protein
MRVRCVDERMSGLTDDRKKETPIHSLGQKKKIQYRTRAPVKSINHILPAVVGGGGHAHENH